MLDGYGSHYTKEFIDYCESAGIIPFGLPAHVTHLLQPLDVCVFQPLKHYHAKAIDLIVRDGYVAITKLEFLGFIEEIRKQAFKEKTILSAFKKTGIFPLNPRVVLRKIEERNPTLARRPRTPEEAEPNSSPFATPLTIRKLKRVRERLEDAMDEIVAENPDPAIHEFRDSMQQFMTGAEIQSNELIQVRRHVRRNKQAEVIQEARREGKNAILRKGGVLRVEDVRDMVRQLEEDELKKAQELVRAAEEKQRRQYKKWFFEAAKKARKWRIHGTLQPIELYEAGRPVRYLRRV